MYLPETDTSWDDFVCPALERFWKLGQHRENQDFLLISPQTRQKNVISEAEAYALRHFNGRYAVKQVQAQVNKQFPDAAADLVAGLIQKLIDWEVLTLGEEGDSPAASVDTPALKSTVEWRFNPDGYWILRNRCDRTFLQVSCQDKIAIEQLGKLSSQAILAEFCITPQHYKRLLQILAATGMLEGTQPMKKPRRGKFNPLQLLFFKIPLFNPDPWLNRHIDKLRFLWSKLFAFGLLFFLVAAWIFGTNQRGEILQFGRDLMQASGSSLLIPFALLSVSVVTLHELGHAFTLKNYNGDVPEVGLLFMCLFPAAYTDTTDQYCLSRFYRTLVVAAGVIVQISIAAIGLCLWNFTVNGSWLHTASYLLMVAALFTVAVNLNPMAKFDGYYLTVAITGINNLRSRAFGFYANLLTGKPIQERPRDCWILAIYAPFSIFYIWCVFGFLFYRLADWLLMNMPTMAAMLLLIWAIYYWWPESK
jgi:putative peptide zinc metalloprotease protein